MTPQDPGPVQGPEPPSRRRGRAREDPVPEEPWTGEGGPGLALADRGEGPATPEPQRDPDELTLEELRRIHQEDVAGPILESESQEGCGRHPVPLERPTVYADAETGQLYLWGLRRCGNSTSCPVCSTRIARKRAARLEEALQRHLDRGGGVAMLTLTIPHHSGHRLEQSYALVADAWRRLKQSALWRDLAEEIGYVGAVTASETTHGPNGWHPHRHVLLLTERPLDQEQLEDLEARIYQRWADRIERCYGFDQEGQPRFRRIDRELPHNYAPTFGRPSREHGVRVQQADTGAAGYVSELGITREVTRMDCKTGRQGHRTPLELLRDYALYGGDKDRELWAEYCQTMKYKPALVWSPGLKDRLLEDEQTDLELAQDDDPEPEDRRIFEVSKGLWRELRAQAGPDPGGTLLEVARRSDDLEGVERELRRRIDPGKRIEVHQEHREIYLLVWNETTRRWDRE